MGKYKVRVEHEGSQYDVDVEAGSPEEAQAAATASFAKKQNPLSFESGPVQDRPTNPELPNSFAQGMLGAGKGMANFALGAAPMMAGAPMTLPTAAIGGIFGALNAYQNPDILSPENAMNVFGAGMGGLRGMGGKVADWYKKAPMLANAAEGAATAGLGVGLSGGNESDYTIPVGIGAAAGAIGGKLSQGLKYKTKFTPTLKTEELKPEISALGGRATPPGVLDTLTNKFRTAAPAIDALDTLASGPKQLKDTEGKIATRLSQPPGTTAGPGNPSLKRAVSYLVDTTQERKKFYGQLKKQYAKGKIQQAAADEMAQNVFSQTGLDPRKMTFEEKDFIKQVASSHESNIASHLFDNPDRAAHFTKSLMSITGGPNSPEAKALQYNATKQLINRITENGVFSHDKLVSTVSKMGPDTLNELYGPGAAARFGDFISVLKNVQDNMHTPGTVKLNTMITPRGLMYVIGGTELAGMTAHSLSAGKAATALAGLGGAVLYQDFGVIAEHILKNDGKMAKVLRQYAANPDLGRTGQGVNRLLQILVNTGAAEEIKLK